MTNEEINQFVRTIKNWIKKGGFRPETVIHLKQALAIIDQLQAKHAWIPVSERLPMRCEFVNLCDCEAKRTYIGFLPLGTDSWNTCDGLKYFTDDKTKWKFMEITHWKPIVLPEDTLAGQG